MEITSVYVIDYKVNDLLTEYQVSLNDEEISNLSKIVELPSDRSMVNYFDNESIQALSTSKKYYISGNEDTESYQLDILKKLLSSAEPASTLKSIDDIFDKEGKLSCNVVAYISEKDNGDKELFLYELSSVNLVKDKGFWIFKKKVGTSNNNAARVEQVENGFNLPTNKCIASLYKRNDVSEGFQYKAKVYQAYDFDQVFNTQQTQHEYVNRTLKKFLDPKKPIKLTSNEIKVSFDEDKIDKIKQTIYEDDYLTKTFVNFHDNKKRTIKKIGIDELKSVLDTLKDYVNNNADAGFGLENIPTINDEGSLEITEASIPTFAALLDNKVIERLLNKAIEIPYFKRHLK